MANTNKPKNDKIVTKPKEGTVTNIEGTNGDGVFGNASNLETGSGYNPIAGPATTPIMGKPSDKALAPGVSRDTINRNKESVGVRDTSDKWFYELAWKGWKERGDAHASDDGSLGPYTGNAPDIHINTRTTGLNDPSKNFDRSVSYKKDSKGNIVIDNLNDVPWRLGKFNRAGYNLEAALNSVGLTYNRTLSRILNHSAINKNKKVNPVDYVDFGRTYVFFTKPDLFLFKKDGSINPSIKANCPDLYAKIKRNPLAAQQLQSIYDVETVTASDKGFIHLLGNMCSSLDMNDMVLSTKDAAMNSKEQGMKYGGDFMEAMKESRISISFFDNRYRDVSTMIEIWTEYIEGLSQGKIYKKRKYRDANILDYAISIYLFVLDETNNIVSMGGFVGCYPSSLNMQLLQHKSDSLDAGAFRGPFSYEWQAAHMMKPNSHSMVQMFNYASGFDRLRHYIEEDKRWGTGYAEAYKAAFYSVPINNNFSAGEQQNSYKNGGATIKYIMHQSIESWGRDITRYNPKIDSEVFKDYEHQLTITEFYPQYAGITLEPKTDGRMAYSLVFFSRMDYLNFQGRNDYDKFIDFDRWNFIDKNGKTGNLVKRGFYYWSRVNSLNLDSTPDIVKDTSTYTKTGRYVDFENTKDGTADALNKVAPPSSNQPPSSPKPDPKLLGRYGSFDTTAGSDDERRNLSFQAGKLSTGGGILGGISNIFKR